MTGTPTTSIEGRTFTVETGGTVYESPVATYGEVVLHGARGARYSSERKTGGSVLRFWKADGRGGLPRLVFGQETFVVDGGTIRPPTLAETQSHWKAVHEARDARSTK